MTQSKKKIVHITTVHQPFDVRIFYKQCRSLAAYGFDVWLIASHEHDEVVDNVHIKAIPKQKSRLRRMLLSGFIAFKHARNLKGDIYHFHDPELIPFGFILAATGHKVVFDMHENITKSILTKPWVPKYLQRPVSLLVYFIEKVLLKKFAVIFAESSYQKDFEFISQSATVLNYPRLEDLQNQTEQKHKDFCVSYLGSISADRGLITTLEALTILEKRGYRCDFDCIGRVPETLQPVISKIVSKLSLQKVRFHGFLSSKDSYKTLAKSHVGLSVLSPAPNYIESIPTKMFEYMALGLPVIVSDFPVLRNILEAHGGGYCIEPNNPNKLADTIARLIDDNAEYQKLSGQGRKTASEHYSWESQFNVLTEFYQRL